MSLLRPILFTLTICCLLGCSKKPVDPVQQPGPVVPAPSETTKALLVSPAKDEVCITGTSISSTKNTIKFKWKESAFSAGYIITIKNLTNAELVTGTTNGTEIELLLTKNFHYSWSVKTRSSLNNSILESDIWKFYNAGEATSSYAPYPAELTSPVMDAKIYVSGGKTNLLWIGDDPDWDILSYDVYFGTTINPPLYQEDYIGTTFPITVTSATTYYWKILTKDRLGNKSESAVFNFTVL
jgi:hypothetical protein